MTFLDSANNLSDVASTTSSATNLGLGTGDSPTFTGLTISGATATVGGNQIETQNNKDVANGYAGLDSNGDVVGTIVLRQDTAAGLASVILAQGQPGYATDTGKFAIGDGSTTFGNLTGISGLIGSTSTNTTSLFLNAYAVVEGRPVSLRSGTLRGQFSHCEGASLAVGEYAHAEGDANLNGNGSYAIGTAAHCEGFASIAAAKNSHTEGNTSIALGSQSHAEGLSCVAGPANYQCTVSGSTVTLTGHDYTAIFPSGATVVLWEGLVSASLHLSASETTVSTSTFSGGNTTLTLAAAQPAYGLPRIARPDTYAASSHAGGISSQAIKPAQWSRAGAKFANVGDGQQTFSYLYAATTSTAQTELTLDGNSPTGTVDGISNRYIVGSSGDGVATIVYKTYACTITVAARDSAGNSAMLKREVVIKNVAGTVSLEGTVQTIGTDINPAGHTLTIQADGTNGSLQVLVTPAATANIRWVATVEAVEIAY
jgi:trimeric autotransporter adhesin